MNVICKIVWHDYGIWEGVTKALEELDQSEVYGPWHKPGVLERAMKREPNKIGGANR